jgi:hypothetical protein
VGAFVGPKDMGSNALRSRGLRVDGSRLGR